jgi:hypothetical protein
MSDLQRRKCTEIAKYCKRLYIRKKRQIEHMKQIREEEEKEKEEEE